MMASAKPSIVTGHEDSEIKINFENSQGGYYFHENTIEVIKRSILHLKNNPKNSNEVGIAARNFVIEHFSYEKVLSEFQLKIEQSVKNK
jgi:colanic acid biosynthesis glycosyl transferase WcaI